MVRVWPDEMLVYGLFIVAIVLFIPLLPFLLMVVFLHPETFWEWIAVLALGVVFYFLVVFIEISISEAL
ncbi:MAG: hypothetical protein DRJ60_06465 [Thermoprotei archaeon]|nr:MAG: hypothetical protein DRJ60_06465 [Thermoprotei archaeon]